MDPSRILPVTPAPRPIAHFDESFINSFPGFISIEFNPQLTVAQHFCDYDAFERYSSERVYTRSTFTEFREGQLRKYQYYICALRVRT